jgi:hypothetical protein
MPDLAPTSSPALSLLSSIGETMTWRIATLSVAVVLLALSTGCGDDDSSPSGPGGGGGTPADFSGSWALALEVIEIDQDGPGRACDRQVGETFSWDLVITQDGTSGTISINGSGPLPITIDGSTATGDWPARDQESIAMALTVSGDELGGTISYCNVCPVDNCWEIYDVVGIREPGGSTTDFSGFWNIGGTWISNECDWPLDPDCVQFVQTGDMVSIVDDGLEGTVDGNTAILQDVIIAGSQTLTATLVLELAGDGNSFTGTTTIDLVDSKNPANDCTSVASSFGNRVSDCPAGN